VHETRRHGADETALHFDPDREGHENGPPCYSPDRDETIFIRRMFVIRRNAGAVGKKGFDLLNRKSVFLALRPVSLNPNRTH